jgi:hypothetical protein
MFEKPIFENVFEILFETDFEKVFEILFEKVFEILFETDFEKVFEKLVDNHFVQPFHSQRSPLRSISPRRRISSCFIKMWPGSSKHPQRR